MKAIDKVIWSYKCITSDVHAKSYWNLTKKKIVAIGRMANF